MMTTWTTCASVRRAGRVLLLVGALAPAIVSAQSAQGPGQIPTANEERIEGPTYGRVFLMFTEAYDSNIFAIPESQHPVSDLVTRFGPTFEVGRNSRRLNLVARYGMAAERFAERYDLNTGIARQDGRIDLRYFSTRRTELHADGSYIDTQSPRELNFATLLNTGRSRAERLSANGGVSQSLTERTKFNGDYTVIKDTLAERTSNLSHTGRLGLAWQASRRTSLRTDYRPRYVEFGTVVTVSTPAPIGSTPGPVVTTPGPEAPVVVVPTIVTTTAKRTQTVTGGITFAATPLTTIDLDAGPRFSDDTVRPEISATFRRRMQRGGEFSVNYLNTQETSFGTVLFGDVPTLEAGFYDVTRLSAVASVTPFRSLTMSATPAFARSTRLGQHSDVRELSADITIRALRRLSFSAAGRVSNQKGTFNAPNDPIRGRLLALTAQVTLP